MAEEEIQTKQNEAEEPEKETAVVETSVQQRYQYPLVKEDEYLARIKFTVLKEEYLRVSNALLEDVVTGAQNIIAPADEQEAQASDATPSVADQEAATAADNAEHNGSRNESKSADSTIIRGDQVVLYMPPGIQFRDAVTYDNMELGMLGAAVAGGAGVGGALKGGVSSFVNAMKGAAMDSRVASLTGKTALMKGAASFSGAEGIAGGITAASGLVTNPNMRSLFKSVTLREFSFAFKMVARSKEEAKHVKDIIKLFRSELYPNDIPLNIGGASISLGYEFPNKFDIQLEYNGTPMANKIKPCNLRDVSVTYNASQMGFHYDEESNTPEFMEVDLTLTFQEAETLNKKDIVEGGF